LLSRAEPRAYLAATQKPAQSEGPITGGPERGAKIPQNV